MKKLGFTFSLLLCSVFASAQAADTLTFVQYNLLKYADASCIPLTTKNNRLKLIFNHLKPDILTVNEMAPNTTAVNSLLNNALVFNPNMKATTFSNTTNSDVVNMLYYNSAKLGYISHSVIKGNIRDIDVYRLFHKAGTQPGDTLDFYCISAHFKASQGNANALERAEAAADINTWLAQRPQILRYMVSGDFNIYSSTEPAFQTLLERFVDPIDQTEGWQGIQYAAVHTQSPADGTDPCAVEGGMDDRFDFIMLSPSVFGAAEAISYAPESYQAVGNNGASYNNALNCVNNYTVPYGVCTTLRNASDHLPVTLKLLVGGNTPVHAPDRAQLQFRFLGNPVLGDFATLYSLENEAGLYQWQLCNTAGQICEQGKQQLAPNQRLEIPLHKLSAGIYFLTLQSFDGRIVSFKLVKG